MLKEIKIDIHSTPPSKKEIDCATDKLDEKLKNLIIGAAIFFFFSLVFSFFDIFSVKINNFVVCGTLFITFTLGAMASCTAERGTLLKPAAISENTEKKIALLTSNNDYVVKNYLEGVKGQGRVLTELEEKSIISFFKERYPEIQLKNLVDACYKKS